MGKQMFHRFGTVVVVFALHFVLASSLVSADEKVGAQNAVVAKDKDAGHHEAGGHHGSHGGHHDPHDLSHANASDSLNDLKEFKSDLAIFSFVVFALLMILLTKFAWKPILDSLQKREESIAKMIDDAKQNQEKSERSLAEYQQKLALAHEEARELISQARREADSLKEKTIAEAQAASQREKERAIADISAAKNLALQEIAQLSVGTAVKLAGRIIRREIKPQDHSQLIRESLEKFPSQN